jgi:scyllo-inositol 2-dehydrogenase (NADP+)
MAMDALQAGKHVVVEKPMTVTSAQAEELCRVAKQKQRCLAVYHNRRWDGDFLTVRRLIEQGKLGQVHRLELQYDRYRPNVRARWKEQSSEGGGVLYDLGAHLLDQSLQLLGRPVSIYAQVKTLRKGAAAADDFLIHLHYPTTEVILRSSSLATASGPRWLILGSLGSFIKYGADPQESQLASGMTPLQPGFGSVPDEPGGCFTDADGKAREIKTTPGAYLQFYQQLHDAITSNTPVPVTGEQGMDVIRLIEAAMQSSRQNRVVVL